MEEGGASSKHQHREWNEHTWTHIGSGFFYFYVVLGVDIKRFEDQIVQRSIDMSNILRDKRERLKILRGRRIVHSFRRDSHISCHRGAGRLHSE